MFLITYILISNHNSAEIPLEMITCNHFSLGMMLFKGFGKMDISYPNFCILLKKYCTSQSAIPFEFCSPLVGGTRRRGCDRLPEKRPSAAVKTSSNHHGRLRFNSRLAEVRKFWVRKKLLKIAKWSYSLSCLKFKELKRSGDEFTFQIKFNFPLLPSMHQWEKWEFWTVVECWIVWRSFELFYIHTNLFSHGVHWTRVFAGIEKWQV